MSAGRDAGIAPVPVVKRVAVFCGSQHGRNPALAEAAAALGRLLAERGLGLVYGGGCIGLMGSLADAALAGGAEVTGVIPRSLVEREVAHTGLSALHVVETMHERKRLMFERADAFVALPGGFGTLDEFCELLTWRQLGYHGRPLGLLNTAGYFDPFLAFVEGAVAEGMVRAEHRAWLHVATEPQALLDVLLAASHGLERAGAIREA